MAKKKRRKKAGRKRKASAAQMRGLRKAWAANRKKRGKKRSTKRRTKKRSTKRRSTKSSVASHMRASMRRGFGAAAARKARRKRASGGSSVASHMKASMGRGFGAVGYVSSASKGRKKAVKRSARRLKTQTVTAASILKGARTARNKAWICAGPRRTGCGGGKRGGHVVGVLR